MMILVRQVVMVLRVASVVSLVPKVMMVSVHQTLTVTSKKALRLV